VCFFIFFLPLNCVEGYLGLLSVSVFLPYLLDIPRYFAFLGGCFVGFAFVTACPHLGAL
jgi:hypothetical protein